MDESQRWGQVRSIVHAEASQEAWRELLKVLRRWPQEQVEPVLSYVEDHVQGWPSSLRKPPKKMHATDPIWRLIRVIEGTGNLRRALASPYAPPIEHYVFDGVDVRSQSWSALWSQSPVFAHAKSIRLGVVSASDVALVLLALEEAAHPPSLEALCVDAYISKREKMLLDRVLRGDTTRGLKTLELSNLATGVGEINWAWLPALERVVLGGPAPEALTPSLLGLAQHARPDVAKIDGHLDGPTAQQMLARGWAPTELQLRYMSLKALEALVTKGGLRRMQALSFRGHVPQRRGGLRGLFRPSSAHALDLLIGEGDHQGLRVLDLARVSSSKRLDGRGWIRGLEVLNLSGPVLHDGFWAKALEQGWGARLRELRLREALTSCDDLMRFLEGASALKVLSLGFAAQVSVEAYRALLRTPGVQGLRRLHLQDQNLELQTWREIVRTSGLNPACEVEVAYRYGSKRLNLKERV